VSAAKMPPIWQAIDYLADGKILIGVTGDEPTYSLANARRELRIAGVQVGDVMYRGSFAFVIAIGSPEETVFAKQINPAINPQTSLRAKIISEYKGLLN